MLILFDIDATLITTARCGIEAMGRAGRALFGESFDEGRVAYAGRLDPVIMRELLDVHGVAPTAETLDTFRREYRTHLNELFSQGWYASACPGVHALIDRLEREPTVTLGLLTGNYPETGSIKLRACGIEPDRFAIRVWADDARGSPPARTDLPPVGIARFRERHSRDPRSVVIIGDTPHDVACARAHRCRSLAVATGQFKLDELRAAGADHAVPDLSGTEEIAAWLLNHDQASLPPS
ncbi:MAG TPA: HAD family hydrolase [Phycisphaerales bacterium]|nr:HAD family hydrolase [Phycisphaerales bacterium]